MTLDIPTFVALVLGPVPLSLAIAFLAKSVAGGAIKTYFDKSIHELKAESAEALARVTAQLAIQADVQREARQVQQSRDERVRAILSTLAAPALDTIESLHRRIENITDDGLDEALAPQFVATEDWSMTHRYARISTVYIFARYFALRTQLCAKLGNEVFGATGDRQEFVKALYRAGAFLSQFPLEDVASEEGVDAQVFTFQQDAIGVGVTLRGTGEPRVLEYGEFSAALRAPSSSNELAELLKPLESFLENVHASPRLRKRLRLFGGAVGGDVKARCHAILWPDRSDGTAGGRGDQT